MYVITLTNEQINDILSQPTQDERWERLADYTEVDPEWLKSHRIRGNPLVNPQIFNEEFRRRGVDLFAVQGNCASWLIALNNSEVKAAWDAALKAAMKGGQS